MIESTYYAKPYMRKTIVKFILMEFIILAIALSPIGIFLFLFNLMGFGLYSLFAVVYFVAYYFNKRAFVFSITDKSIRIQKSWTFGTYEREITLDQIRDVQINQGFLARKFNCGSLIFVTTSGLEVGYTHAGTGAGVNMGGLLVGGGVGSSTPHVLKGRGNKFWDIQNPSSVRQALIVRLSEWRGVFQEQKMAASLEKITERMPSSTPTSLVGDLERLNALFEKGAITKVEYEKTKERLLISES